MKKQYNLKIDGEAKQMLSTYHDGKLVESKIYDIDELNNVIDKLEEDGYVYGYTQEEVATMKRRYERMLRNIIN